MSRPRPPTMSPPTNNARMKPASEKWTMRAAANGIRTAILTQDVYPPPAAAVGPSGEDNGASDVWLGSRWACTGTHVIEVDERLLSRLPITEVRHEQRIWS